MKVLYLTLESYTHQPILKSQVVSLLNFIASHYTHKNSAIKFYLTTRDELVIPEISSDHIVHIPLKGKNYLLNQVELLQKIHKIAREVDIIHVRSYFPMFIAIIIKIAYNKPVIFDMRGVLPEEIALRKKNKAVYTVLKQAERLFCKMADKLVVVSQNFKKHISTLYPSGKDKIAVIPTFVSIKKLVTVDESEIKKMKRDIFKDESVVLFVYSGAFEKWQCVDEVFDLFRVILANNPSARFVILSHHHDQFRNHAEKIEFDLSKIYITYVENKFLNYYLKQCDIGVLLRKDTLINQVAAPIKFTDYLGAGLLLIISDNIGDASAIVKDNSLGYVLPDMEEPTLAKCAKDILAVYEHCITGKKERIENALKALSIESTSQKYLELYQELFPIG